MYYIKEEKTLNIIGYQTYVIGYTLTMKVRRLKFETDGTFKYIILDYCLPVDKVFYVEENLNIGADFDYTKYQELSWDEKNLYLMNSIKDAIVKLSHYKRIPKDDILRFCDELIADGFVYRWKFRGMRLPEYKLKLAFNCTLSTRDFVLDLTVHRYGEKEPLCQGRVIRTLPDWLFFSHISRNILVENDRIIISDQFHNKLIYLEISDIYKAKVIPRLVEPDDPNDERMRAYLWESQQYWCYDNDEFK